MFRKFGKTDYNRVRRNRKGTIVLGTGPNDIGTAQWIVGGTSEPSKMPGPSYNLTTRVCNVGGMLRNVKGSVCEGCYADGRGRYRFDTVYNAGMRRLGRVRQALNDDEFLVLYVEAFTAMLKRVEHMRWHDAGDLISTRHMALIAAIATETPNTVHWLPTKEYGRVLDFMSDREIPANLTVRVSGYMVDEAAPIVAAGLVTSTVTAKNEGTGVDCPAVKNHTSCNGIPMKDGKGKRKGKRKHPACRACWNRNVSNVNYALHTAKVSCPSVTDAAKAADIWGKQAGQKSVQEALAAGEMVAV